jgi:hypothetical protein
MWNAQKVEYLGKFKTKIEKKLLTLSGAQMDLFDQTTLNKKISCKCTFKGIVLQKLTWVKNMLKQ